MRNLRVISCFLVLQLGCGLTFSARAQLNVDFDPTVTFQDQPRHLNDLMTSPVFSNFSFGQGLDNSHQIISGAFFPKLEYNPYMLPALPEIPRVATTNFSELNYSNYRLIPFPDSNTALLLNNRQEVYMGLGAANALSGSLLLHPNERWQISLTGTGQRSVDFTGLRTNFTVGGATRFALTDRIGLNAFGAYVLNQQNTLNHQLPVLSPMAPRNYYGGTIDFRITDHWGLEGGVKYEFNPFNGKWERQFIIGPKYYK